jgi:ribonuclease HI
MKPTFTKTKSGKIHVKGGMCDFTVLPSSISLARDDDNPVPEGWIQVNGIRLCLSDDKYEELSSLLTPSSIRRTSKLDLYTDGSANPNPGPGGWGAVLYEDSVEIKSAKGGHPGCGNGKMEIMATVKGLELIPLGVEASIWIDAKYALDTIGQGLCPPEGPQGWIKGWKKNSWKKKDGEVVKNLKEVKLLYEIIIKHCEAGSALTFKWVKSHSGVEGNERADELANEGREEN